MSETEKQREKHEYNFFLSHHYPCTIIKARYGGVYEDAPWIAFIEDVESNRLTDVQGDDTECSMFFSEYGRPIGRGDTPQEAFDDLVKECKKRITDESSNDPPS